MRKIMLGLCVVAPQVFANSLLDLTDKQFVQLFGTDVPDECVNYYLGNTQALNQEMDNLAIIDKPGYASRPATADEKNATLNDLLGVLEKRCYQDVKRAIVTNNYHEGMPKHLYADDFSDRRVLARFQQLIGLDK
jgi:hypothetical protein